MTMESLSHSYPLCPWILSWLCDKGWTAEKHTSYPALHSFLFDFPSLQHTDGFLSIRNHLFSHCFFPVTKFVFSFIFLLPFSFQDTRHSPALFFLQNHLVQGYHDLHISHYDGQPGCYLAWPTSYISCRRSLRCLQKSFFMFSHTLLFLASSPIGWFFPVSLMVFSPLW